LQAATCNCMLTFPPELHMSKLTARSVSLEGESRLEARLCAEIGAQLARVRESRGITRSEMGEKLLLSIRQVKALEEVDVTAFHNATFQLKALTKYAQFAEIDPALIARLAASIVTAGPEAPSDDEADFVVSMNGSRQRLAAVASVLLGAAVFAGGFYLLRARSVTGPVGSVVVAAQVPVAPEPSTIAPAAAAPASAPVESTGPSSGTPSEPAVASTPPMFGALRVLHQTWIFVRDADGIVIEKLLGAGESINLESQPTYLAVGMTDAELTIGGAPVDLSRFITNGQVRIRAGDFDALVQGASPIPAPTAAVAP